jgi:diketogulonate reductase-like aldo/keto reductase
MEAIHDSGRVRLLGVSNVGHDQLELLCAKARVRPTFVQNRCYADQGWDREVRTFCAAEHLAYQGFSLLTANRDLLKRQELRRIAEHYGRTASEIVFRFAMDVGMIPLTGTTSAEHMQVDLSIFDFRLNAEEVAVIECMAG